jgi:predicted nucleic acid-binding protein
LRERFLWTAEAAEEQAVRLLRIARLVNPTESIDAVPDDPDDNRILECAVTARSDYVVSGTSTSCGLAAMAASRSSRWPIF